MMSQRLPLGHFLIAFILKIQTGQTRIALQTKNIVRNFFVGADDQGTSYFKGIDDL